MTLSLTQAAYRGVKTLLQQLHHLIMSIIQSMTDIVGQAFKDLVAGIRVLLAEALQLPANDAIGAAVGEGQGSGCVAIPAQGGRPAEDPTRLDGGHRDRLTVLRSILDRYLPFFEKVKILGGGILLEDLHSRRQFHRLDDGQEQIQRLTSKVPKYMHVLKIRF